ncbi:MAG TPA: hypothetical protein VGO93_16000 [Candidatus Xenobia bacterium]
MTSVTTLDLHGLEIACETESAELASALVRPFRYFLAASPAPRVRVVVHEAAPPLEGFPPMPALFSSPRNIVFGDRARKIVDYFGRGIVVQERGQPCYRLYSQDRDLLLEAFYLLVLSLLGEHCDRVGLLRVHALALSHRDRAVLLMMPQGGGKSTLTLSMLQVPGVGYISDDDPLFDRHGQILPFPRPLGMLRAEALAAIPPQYVYSLQRMEFGVKHFVDSEWWGDRLERRRLRRIVLLTTQRVLNGTPRIEPISKMEALRSLLRDAVVGIGLYQGVEFIFNHSTWEALAWGPILAGRLGRAFRLAQQASTWRLTLGSDVAANAAVLRDFLES